MRAQAPAKLASCSESRGLECPRAMRPSPREASERTSGSLELILTLRFAVLSLLTANTRYGSDAEQRRAHRPR